MMKQSRGITLLLCGLLLSGTACAAASRPLAGLSYSPSGIAAETDLTRTVTPEQLRADLAPLAALTPRIRTYALANGLNQLIPTAKELGLTVSLGIGLRLDATLNGAEIDRALAVIKANPGVIDRVFVGNEVLEGDLGPGSGALRGYIGRIKAALADTGIKVGTGEPWSAWIDHPEVAAMCDFIGADIEPYRDGVPVAGAAAYTLQRYQQLVKAYPDKTVIIAETGWPTAGAVKKGAVPSQAAQTRYLRDFVRAATAAHTDYYIAEAYDQPWKAAREGVGGAAWGILDANRRPKFGF